MLGEAVDMVGGPQIRNIGTIGGNTCNGVTSADSASTLVAYDAIVELSGPEGVRLVPIQSFYIKAGKVDLRPGEIETAILIPQASYRGYHGHYIKYAMRNAMDIATCGCFGKRQAFSRWKDHRGCKARLRRCGGRCPSRAFRRGRRARQARLQGNGGSVCKGSA